MQKDFDSWNNKKKGIDVSTFKGYIHEREIWWCSLGLNIDNEQDGKNEFFERPVLIIPLTTRIKENKYYFSFIHQNIQYAGILSQLRLISTKRLSRRIRKMDNTLFRVIKNKIVEVAITL